VFVAIVMFCHCSDGMTRQGMPLYLLGFATAGMRSAWD
jgi:hypothetical protein